MRRIALTFVVFGFLALLSLPAAAQQTDDHAKALERLQMVRVYLLVEELDLSADQAPRLIPIFQKYDRLFGDIIDRKEHTYTALNQELQAQTPDPRKLAELTDLILGMDREAMKLREAQYSELKKQLTPLQCAKFLIFEKKYHREMNRILDDIRGRRPQKSEGKPKPQQ